MVQVLVMGTNDPIINAIYKRLEDLEQKVGKVPRNKLVKEAIKVPKQITNDIGALIRKDYNEINEAIHRLDTSDIDFPHKKHELQELKAKVPHKYSISKKLRTKILDDINKILGVNRSDST